MDDKRIGPILKMVQDTMVKQANNDLRSRDLTLAQTDVLFALAHADRRRMSMKSLEKRFGVRQPTMFGIVSRLCQKGLVETLLDPSDGRVRLAHITPAGLECLDGAESHMWEAEKMLVLGFSEEEKEQFRSFLLRTLRNLQQE